VKLVGPLFVTAFTTPPAARHIPLSNSTYLPEIRELPPANRITDSQVRPLSSAKTPGFVTTIDSIVIQ